MFALSACTHFTFQHKDQKVYVVISNVSSPESSKQYCFDHPKYVLTGLRVFELHYIAKKAWIEWKTFFGIIKMVLNRLNHLLKYMSIMAIFHMDMDMLKSKVTLK